MFKKIKDTFAGKSDAKDTKGVKTQIEMTDDESREASIIAKKNEAMILTDEQKSTVMGKMVGSMKNPPQIGDLVEGPVIAIEKSSIYIDLTPFGTGIIYGREFIVARDVIKKINIGDTIAAKIVDNSHPEAYFELSLKEARQALIWNEAEGFPYADRNPYHGPAAVGEGVFYRLATEWDYFHVVPEKFIDAGNTIIMTGRYKAAYKATGRILNAQAAHVWQLRDGKAISFQQYTDTAQAQAVTKT